MKDIKIVQFIWKLQKMKDKLGIVGVGFVGQAVARGFNLFAEVFTYDKDPKKSANTLEEVLNTDFVFICLPTPMKSAEGAEADLSIIEDFFDIANEKLKEKIKPIFIIKSTVPIGTTVKLNEKYVDLPIVHSPEFLTARTANLDFITPARNIVGGKEIYAEKVADLYKNRFPGVQCLTMSSDESEMVKYAINCFFATKIMFFNEMKTLAENKNINWDSFLEGFMSDGRIAHSHFQVPGHDGHYGFGGTCFSKDINALIKSIEDTGFDPIVLKSVWEQNKRIRKYWDWADSPSAVVQKKEKK